jgi:hypothetical protein
MKLYDDNMDARLYTDYMARHMRPCALRLWPNEQWYFLQDGAGYHTARASYQWFHNNGVSLIQLSPYSPDLNPIENLWADLKRRVEARNASNTQDLKQIISEEWVNTSTDLCSRSAHSMQRRCELVVEAQGLRTPY